MPNIHIIWTTDDHDCDDCGPSFADGARVDIEGRGPIELAPSAGCYDGVSHSRLDVFMAILARIGRIPVGYDEQRCREFIESLGYEINEENGD
ncbi:hypothetical protein OIU34_22805 [Pararhizobium sp. BT-229]|uniref:hypothetical protein n=1 Tax=Pararhizobium sp. BT-229 TaxID=2986923 RepID=UPI0021F78B8E|nr:hypothetical protein [Pararhizobium sp. BT-229]MCV9964725.1 hypothetical protein [Pararhizobium sp. BT-229]